MPARHDLIEDVLIAADYPLPTGAEALDEPFRAFPSWFMRITCDRCGKDRMISETHAAQGDMLIRDILKRHASRRLRRTTGQGGTAHRHRGRQRPSSAEDRTDRTIVRHCALTISVCVRRHQSKSDQGPIQ
jgi:hypothetical protein